MKSLEELSKIREEKRKELDLRKNVNADTREKHILVCQGTGCTSSKSPKILERFKTLIEEKKIENVVYDRGGYIYHGVVKELAESAREAGLKF